MEYKKALEPNLLCRASLCVDEYCMVYEVTSISFFRCVFLWFVVGLQGELSLGRIRDCSSLIHALIV